MIKDLPYLKKEDLKGDEKIPICNKDGKIIGFMELKTFLPNTWNNL